MLIHTLRTMWVVLGCQWVATHGMGGWRAGGLRVALSVGEQPHQRTNPATQKPPRETHPRTTHPSAALIALCPQLAAA